MKFEQQGPEFRPIVITLETEEEAKVLKNLVGMTNGIDGGSVCYKLWEALDEAGVPHQEYFKVSRNFSVVTSIAFNEE